MEIHDYLRILQARWKIIAIAVVVGILGALGVSLLTTPVYQATTRLFVSTSSGDSVNEIYQGNLFSQQRVASYTRLLTGSTLAQRTLDAMNDPGMTAGELARNVRASSAADTVLIDVKVSDESPERARDLANTLSDQFVAMVRELETPENGQEPSVRVVVEQHAATPANPVSPRTERNLAIGLAVGLLLGIGLAVLRDRLDNTVKDRTTMEDIVGAGVVGNIPLDGDRRAEPAISFQDSNSGSAEAYRALRTNLQFLDVDHPPRVIVITSALPSEGKTTTAINVALALAEAGHPVVLVDGDLRRPRVSTYLGTLSEVGLSTVLSGQATVDDVLQPSAFDNLTVLGSGPLPPNPSELLGSTAAKRVLDELRSRFTYVIVDASPLLPVTDPAVLTAASDGALVVARYGKTTREQLGRAIESLNGAGARVLGGVITMTPSKRRGTYQYEYYFESDESMAAAPGSTAIRPTAPVEPAGIHGARLPSPASESPARDMDSVARHSETSPTPDARVAVPAPHQAPRNRSVT